MKKIVLLSVIAILVQHAFAQDRPEEMVAKFFNQYFSNPSKALDEIYSTNVWTARIKDGIEKMKQEVSSYTEGYMGKYFGYELITRKQLSESFILVSYMLKYERQPIRFTFEFYKPNDKWFLFSLKIDSDIDTEIEQAAKLFYMNLDHK